MLKLLTVCIAAERPDLCGRVFPTQQVYVQYILFANATLNQVHSIRQCVSRYVRVRTRHSMLSN